MSPAPHHQIRESPPRDRFASLHDAIGGRSNSSRRDEHADDGVVRALPTRNSPLPILPTYPRALSFAPGARHTVMAA